MNLFELVAKLSLDSSDYEKGLAGAEQDAKKFGSSGLTKLAGFAKTGAKALAAVGTAAIGAGGAVLKLTGSVAQVGDTIDKESQKMGISAKAYQEWDAIMQHAGGSVSDIKMGLVTLSKQVQKNSTDFEKLGLNVEDLQKMSKEDIFAEVVKRLQGMEEGTERTAIATNLLGRSSKELGALLNTSAEETEEMRKAVHELGGVMSDEAVKASAQYQDSLQDLKTSFQGLVRGAVTKALPAVSSAFNSLARFLSGPEGKKIQQTLAKIIEAIANAVKKILPKLLSLLDDGGKKIKIFAAAVAAAMLVIKASSGPVGMLTAALGALAGVLGIAALSAENAEDSLGHLTDEQKNNLAACLDGIQAYKDLRKARDDSFATIDEETKQTQDLWAELQTLVDENGKLLDEGYKPRAEYITGELANALGKEIEWNGKTIKSYQEIQAEIDKLIQKRRAERKLAAGEELAKQAESQLPSVQASITDAQKQVDDALSELSAWQKKVWNIDQMTGVEGFMARNSVAYARFKEQVDLWTVTYKEKVDALNNLKAQESDLYYDITMQDQAYALVEQGLYDELDNLFANSQSEKMRLRAESHTLTKQQLDDMLHDAQVASQAADRYFEELQKGTAGRTQEEYDRMRKTANGLINLWRDSAVEFYDFGDGASKAILDGIEDGLKPVSTMTVRKSAKDLGFSVVDGFSESIVGLAGVGKNAVDSLTSAVEAGKSGAIAAMRGVAAAMVHEAKQVLMIKSPSKVFKDIGKQIDRGLALGLMDEQDYVEDVAGEVARSTLAPFGEAETASVNGGSGESVIDLLRDIRDNLGFDVVLEDGTIAGRIDKLLGQSAMRKARGSA